MPYQVIFRAATPQPADTVYGIAINEELPPTWAQAEAGNYYGDLIKFEEGLSIGVDVLEDPALISTITASVNASEPDKWIIQLAFSGVILAETDPIDKSSIAQIDVKPFQPATLRILEAQEAGETPEEPERQRLTTATITETPTIERPKEIETPDIPFPFGWLRPVIEFFDSWFKKYTADVDARAAEGVENLKRISEDNKTELTGIKDTLEGLNAFIQDPAGFIVKAATGAVQSVDANKDLIISEAEKEIVITSIKPEQFKSPEFKRTVEKLRKDMTGTPDNISEFLGAIFIEPARALFDAIETFILPEPPVDFDKANESRLKLFALVIDFMVLSSLLDVISTAVSVTLIRNIAQYARNFILLFNFGDLIALVTKPSLEIAIKEPMEREFNKRFLNKKLGVSDAIEAVVKEVETLEQFKTRMSELGYPEYEAQVIWDKHFIAPRYEQILIAWRRGLITDERLKELFLLVDLDPRFDNIWDELRYKDPNITQARFMYETGAINEDEVEEIVKREGLTPQFTENMKNYIVNYQERLWRRRYLIRLQQAYIIGIRNEQQLRTEIRAANYTEGVADWIIRDSNLRREIAQSRRRPVTLKGLTRSQVLDALKEDRFNEEDARQQLQELGYSEAAISIMIEQGLSDREAFLQRDVKIRTLTPAQIVKGLAGELLTDEDARNRLREYGYNEIDIEILIRLSIKPEEEEV